MNRCRLPWDSSDAGASCEPVTLVKIGIAGLRTRVMGKKKERESEWENEVDWPRWQEKVGNIDAAKQKQCAQIRLKKEAEKCACAWANFSHQL